MSIIKIDMNSPEFQERMDKTVKFTDKVCESRGWVYNPEQEVNEGVHFTWDQGMQILELAHKHYGEDGRVAYISNRIYSYSLHAQDWLKFFNRYNNIDALAIVTYSKIGLMNIVLEKIFSKVPIKKFKSLDGAIEWVMQPKNTQKVK